MGRVRRPYGVPGRAPRASSPGEVVTERVVVDARSG